VVFENNSIIKCRKELSDLRERPDIDEDEEDFESGESGVVGGNVLSP
jgi:hypothetical protein